MLAMLFACGCRRSELVSLELDEVQMRQGHTDSVMGEGRARSAHVGEFIPLYFLPHGRRK
jgi:site-specific recombinase XerD